MTSSSWRDGRGAARLTRIRVHHAHVRWDDNAYGSILWLILGLHTTHLITDFADTVVLTV